MAGFMHLMPATFPRPASRTPLPVFFQYKMGAPIFQKAPTFTYHLPLITKHSHQNAGISPSEKLSLIYFFTDSLWKIFTNFW